MSARGRFTNTRRGAPRGNLRREVTNLKHAINGVRTSPSDNPGTYVMVPWNSFVYEKSVVTTSTTQAFPNTVNDILSQLVLRVGLSTATSVGIKIQSAQCWCTCAGATFAVPDLTAEFHELSSPQAGNTTRSLQRDKGTLNMPAKAGYRFPVSDSKEILDHAGSASNDVVTATGEDIGSVLTVRIQFLWRANVL